MSDSVRTEGGNRGVLRNSGNMGGGGFVFAGNWRFLAFENDQSHTDKRCQIITKLFGRLCRNDAKISVRSKLHCGSLQEEMAMANKNLKML